MRRLLTALILLTALVLLCAFAVPPQYGETYLAELPAKRQRLREAEGRRIIVIGGSNVPFALRSGLMEQELPGWAVVDFGLYADMGLTVMLDLARPELRAGDLVILQPELSAAALSTRVNGEDVLQAADGHFDLLTSLRPGSWPAVLAALPRFAARKLHYAVNGAPAPDGVYSRGAFDAWGDIAAPRPQCILPGGRDANSPISFHSGVISDEMRAALRDFISAAEAAGAAVVWHFPPMNRAAVQDSASRLDALYDDVAAALRIPILGDPHRCVLDSGWFYDTNFHLNEAGALAFTRLLTEDIKVYLRDTSATRLPSPAMPAPAFRAAGGSSGDADCFLYEAVDGGVIITGLSEKGLAADQLTLPAHSGEAAVTAIRPDALSGAARLRSLTIQPNIGLLPDGLLSPCPFLQALILPGPPEAWTPGDGLLRGVSCRILVPADQLPRYLTHYTWQKYAPYLAAMEE